MRRLFPEPALIDREALYADLTFPTAPGRPWVFIGMVSSVDGAAAINGDTSDLGGAADAEAFMKLRAAADAIIVGAGTVRAERYGRAKLPEKVQAVRVAKGQARLPQLIVVSAKLTLDFLAPPFSPDDGPMPLIATSRTSGPLHRAQAEQKAEVITHETDHVDLEQLMRQLAARGISNVLCEGGPSLSGQLVELGLADEIFLTITPTAVGGSSPRIMRTQSDRGRALVLHEVHEDAGELLLRYRFGPEAR